MDLAWWILILPLLSFILIPFVPEKNRSLAGWLATLGIICSFLLTLKLAWLIMNEKFFPTQYGLIPWIVIPGLRLEFGVFRI